MVIKINILFSLHLCFDHWVSILGFTHGFIYLHHVIFYNSVQSKGSVTNFFNSEKLINVNLESVLRDTRGREMKLYVEKYREKRIEFVTTRIRRPKRERCDSIVHCHRAAD